MLRENAPMTRLSWFLSFIWEQQSRRRIAPSVCPSSFSGPGPCTSTSHIITHQRLEMREREACGKHKESWLKGKLAFLGGVPFQTQNCVKIWWDHVHWKSIEGTKERRRQPRLSSVSTDGNDLGLSLVKSSFVASGCDERGIYNSPHKHSQSISKLTQRFPCSRSQWFFYLNSSRYANDSSELWPRRHMTKGRHPGELWNEAVDERPMTWGGLNARARTN